MGCACIHIKLAKHGKRPENRINSYFHKPGAENQFGEIEGLQRNNHRNATLTNSYNLGSSSDVSMITFVKEVLEPDILSKTESAQKLSLTSLDERNAMIQDFDWQTSSHGMPLLARANLEILGTEENTLYIQEMYENLKHFLLSEQESSLPGPLDLFWRICVSYTISYKDFCTKILGKIVHRSEAVMNSKFLSLYDFSEEQWDLDQRSTLWISKSSLPVIMNAIKTKSNFPDILNEVRVKLDVSKQVNRNKINAAKYHRFYTKAEHTLEETKRMINDHLGPVEGKLLKILHRELPIHKYPGFAEELITEYKRFLTMKLFTKHRLVPSWLVSYVWLTHIGFTHEYYRCSHQLFGEVIPFVHTNFTPTETIHGLKEEFLNTKDFYRFLFQENPDEAIWDTSVSNRMWVSVFRVFNFVTSTCTIQRSVPELCDSFFGNYNKVVEEQFLEKNYWACSRERDEEREICPSEYWQSQLSSPGLSEFYSMEETPKILL